MIVRGSTSVGAPRAALWSVLSDPARLGEALPGVDHVAIEDDRRFSADVRAATALGETPLALDFEIVEQRPGEFVRIDGAGSAGENQLALSVELSLADDGAGTTASWSADVRLRGVLGSLLQRGLPSLFNEQVGAMLAAGALMCEAAGGG